LHDAKQQRRNGERDEAYDRAQQPPLRGAQYGMGSKARSASTGHGVAVGVVRDMTHCMQTTRISGRSISPRSGCVTNFERDR
jgi:hypothetical protein